MMLASAKLSAAVVIQSSGVALVQCTLSAYAAQGAVQCQGGQGGEGEGQGAAGAGPQQRGGPTVEEHGHDEDRGWQSLTTRAPCC
jgi:hypothetical protein